MNYKNLPKSKITGVFIVLIPKKEKTIFRQQMPFGDESKFCIGNF